MFALMVSNGDTTSLKGVFSDPAKIDPVIEQIRKDCRCTADDVFMMAELHDVGDDPKKTFLSVYDTFAEDWSLLFTIISLDVDEELDIEV